MSGDPTDKNALHCKLFPSFCADFASAIPTFVSPPTDVGLTPYQRWVDRTHAHITAGGSRSSKYIVGPSSISTVGPTSNWPGGVVRPACLALYSEEPIGLISLAHFSSCSLSPAFAYHYLH
ncbi:hypothetical protein PCASD_01398 [Puccinia coronata f. sp. avenae]|uniref:Uncharacterized protein n=1 Tax=Puccinia coronata f. sp. avenae TaxID=200324 RepID=A0A2N5VKN8_9BASI|nr:hypothetical protein PCASD_01398 [Puccinia coronata f. sp. avenae]